MQHILFVRHGESTDDLDNQYGGWADFELTDHGQEQLQVVADKIKNHEIKYDRIFTSPLKRAGQSAGIIAETLGIEGETMLYLKEKNGYGLLSGLNKEFALKNYPELVEELDGEYCPGAEPEEKFVERVGIAIEKLITLPYQNIIALTHGGFLSRMIQIKLGKKSIKIGDGGMLLVKVGENNQLEIVSSDNFSYE